MIKFFRTIRQSLIMNNQSSKYFKYAIGEIILVVIGILIALQINNWNTNRLKRIEEVKYLINIKEDLLKDLKSLDYQLKFRKEKYKGTKKLIEQINGAPVKDLEELTFNVVNTLMEERFTPINSTFNELNSSGNLNIISNDSIKSLLVELQEDYKNNDFSIEHETYDYREYVSKPLFGLTPMRKVYPIYHGTKTADEQGISLKTFEPLFNSADYRNGIFIANDMTYFFLGFYQSIKAKTQRLVDYINQEINNSEN